MSDKKDEHIFMYVYAVHCAYRQICTHFRGWNERLNDTAYLWHFLVNHLLLVLFTRNIRLRIISLRFMFWCECVLSVQIAWITLSWIGLLRFVLITQFVCVELKLILCPVRSKEHFIHQHIYTSLRERETAKSSLSYRHHSTNVKIHPATATTTNIGVHSQNIDRKLLLRARTSSLLDCDAAWCVRAACVWGIWIGERGARVHR